MDEKLRIGDDGNVIGIIVLSQSDPPKAMVEFLDRDHLISRSQAKRVLARVELFRTVLFDFSRVSSIGQAFADEIFRVFARTPSPLVHRGPRPDSDVGRDEDFERSMATHEADGVSSGLGSHQRSRRRRQLFAYLS